MVNTGGPAFPIPLNQDETYKSHSPYDGMTLRDYFAAKAMQAYIGKYSHPEDIARLSYNLADAMLKQKDLK